MNGHGPPHGFHPHVQIPITGPSHRGAEEPLVSPQFPPPNSVHSRRLGPPGATPFSSPTPSIRSGRGRERHFSPPPPTGGPTVPPMPLPSSIHSPHPRHVTSPPSFAAPPPGPSKPPGPMRNSHSGHAHDGPRYNIPINSGSAHDRPYLPPKPEVPRGYAPPEMMVRPHQSSSSSAHLGPSRDVRFAPPPGPPPTAAPSQASSSRRSGTCLFFFACEIERESLLVGGSHPSALKKPR
jgi:hypothetical protein